jgi:hypothetical protein
MSIVSILAFQAAGASHRAHVPAFVDEQPAAQLRGHPSERFEMVNVMVASRDALQARLALLACPATFILRCVPMHKDDRVKLEIRFPAGQGEAVISRILACLPNGEIGGIVACASPRARAHHAGSNMEQLRGH